MEKTKKCEHCDVMKSVVYFANDDSELSEWCRSCELRRAFQPQACSKCMKSKFWQDFPISDQKSAESCGDVAEKPICLACRLKGGTRYCSSCKSSKTWTAFPKRSLCKGTKEYLLRCNDCFTCEGCKTTKKDARSFRRVHDTAGLVIRRMKLINAKYVK